MVNCHNMATGPNLHCGKDADARRHWVASATAHVGLAAQHCQIDTA